MYSAPFYLGRACKQKPTRFPHWTKTLANSSSIYIDSNGTFKQSKKQVHNKSIKNSLESLRTLSTENIQCKAILTTSITTLIPTATVK